MFGCCLLWVYLTCSSSNLDVRCKNVRFSSHLGSFWKLFYQLFFLALFLFPSFWDSHYAYIGMIDGVSQISVTIFFTLFPLFSSDWIIWIDLSSSLLIISSAPLVEFSFQLLFFLGSEFLFFSFFLYSLSLYWYSLVRHHSHTCLSSLTMISFSSLNIV